MTILATLDGSLTVTPTAVTLDGSLELIDNSPFFIDLTTSAIAAIAHAQRYSRLGIGLEIDRGDGTMVAVPSRDLGDVFTIEESAEAFGDRATIKLVGERASPFLRPLLRSRAKVVARVVTGSPQAEHRAKVFTGWIVQPTFDVQPPSNTITLMDAAGLYAQRRAPDWSLPPNSGKSRRQVAIELLTIGAIPVGVLDLGPDDGGIVTKPQTLGDRPIIEFLADYLGVLGVEIGLPDGAFTAERYDAARPPVLELNPSNLIVPVGLSWPLTLDPNVTGVVFVSFTREEANGVRMVESSQITVGPYAPEQYEFLQNGDGSLTANPNPPQTVKERTLSEIITRTSYLGALDVRTEQTVNEWYAVRGSRSQIWNVITPEILPATGPFVNGMNSYIFPDGSTRAEPIEKFRRVRKSIRTKDTDAGGNVVGIREERYLFRFRNVALWQVIGGNDQLQVVGAFINDDGDGVLEGREIMGLLVNDAGNMMEGGAPINSLYLMPDELTETSFTLDDDGAITEEITTEYAHGIGTELRRMENTYGYGTDNRRYGTREAETFTGAASPYGKITRSEKRYRALDEDRYETTTVVRVNGGKPTTTTGIAIGSLPRPERVGPSSSSQEVRADVRDELRIGLAGEEITRVEHNEYLENRAEATVYARHLARKASAVRLRAAMPFEGRVHKWKMVRVNLPGASIDGLNFYVREVVRDASTFSQTLVADHYAPELD